MSQSSTYFQFDERIINLAESAQDLAKTAFEAIDRRAFRNQAKVLAAFSKNAVSDTHFINTTGYGYGDRGRDTLDRVYADVFGTQDALVRPHFTSGTHALCTALFGVLRPGDVLLSVTGKPYDTLDNIIGISGNTDGSLAEFGVKYRQIELLPGGEIDIGAVLDALTDDVKVVFAQRSKGYALRPAQSVKAIAHLASEVKKKKPDVIVMVDNCYGEFVEELEPTDAGADLIAGSLIKNPGGGMAETGGYVAGKAGLVEKVACRLTAPGIGKECGASLGQNRNMYRGLFLAPHVVKEALKTAVFAASLFELLGFEVYPKPLDERFDIVQAVIFKKPEPLLAFCRGIQKGAPVDSFVVPEPWDMPGYNCQVVMAAGSFVQGSSIELSADAPMREPYVAYLQGGLTYESGKLGVMLAAQTMLDSGLLPV